MYIWTVQTDWNKKKLFVLKILFTFSELPSKSLFLHYIKMWCSIAVHESGRFSRSPNLNASQVTKTKNITQTGVAICCIFLKIILYVWYHGSLLQSCFLEALTPKIRYSVAKAIWSNRLLPQSKFALRNLVCKGRLQ